MRTHTHTSKFPIISIAYSLRLRTKIQSGYSYLIFLLKSETSLTSNVLSNNNNKKCVCPYSQWYSKEIATTAIRVEHFIDYQPQITFGQGCGLNKVGLMNLVYKQVS